MAPASSRACDGRAPDAPWRTDPRHRAWDLIHDLIPAGWQVGPTSRSQDPSRTAWTVAARGPIRGRRKPPESIAVEGEDELAALTDLALALREYGKPDRMAAIERRARLAYYRGAQEWSLEATGEPMTADVQERVLERTRRRPVHEERLGLMTR